MINKKSDYKIGKEIRAWSINIPDRAIDELRKTIKSKWINTGPREKDFRRKVKNQFKAKYAVATNSGTSSLRLALAAHNIGRGDEVISTAYTWIATNTAILEAGAKPIFADVNYDDLNISIKDIEKKITKKTKAVICVHYAGNPVDLDQLKNLCKKYKIHLIEDCAHAMGSKYKNMPIGSSKNISCFSFQCVKIVTCGDGGAVTCGDKKIYQNLQSKVWYGFDRDKKKVNFFNPNAEDTNGLGFKMNMNDIVATLACVAMDELKTALKQRVKMGKTYREELSNLSKIKLLNYKNDRTPNYQIFPIHVYNRKKFAKFMWDNNVQVNINNRRNDSYSIFGGLNKSLKNLNAVDKDVILLPIHSNLRDNDLERIISLVKRYDSN
jgi:perosamine synthetase